MRWLVEMYLELGLAVKTASEGLVVECASWSVGTSPRAHSRDAVLSLLWWQLPSEFLGKDVSLVASEYFE